MSPLEKGGHRFLRPSSMAGVGNSSFSSSSLVALLSFRMSIARKDSGDDGQNPASLKDRCLGLLWKWKHLVFLLLLSLLLVFCLQFVFDHQPGDLASTFKYRFSIPGTHNTAAADAAASVEDDPSCLSRTQHLLLRREDEQILPPELSRALLEHEEMQARCYHGRNLTQVFSSPDPADSCKYLVLLNDGKFGLGNHILSLVSAFLYALLTNRMLLLDTRGHLSKLLCEPFANSSWLLPPEFPYYHLTHAPFLSSDVNKLGHVVHLMLMQQQSDEDQQFFCTESQSRLEQVPWLAWSSCQYYAARLFAHPSFWRRLVEWFPDPSMVSTHLGRYLLLPQNQLWSRISRIYSTYLSTPGKLVGLQIRLHYQADEGSFDPEIYDRILRCLLGKGLLPNVTASGGLLQAQQRIRYQIKHPQEPNTVKVFVTCLQARYSESLKRMYLASPTVDGSLVQVHTLTHDGAQSFDYDQAANAFVEIWLLSFSDRIVTSSWSTFGYIAQALAGLRPYILHIRGDFKSSKLPACTLSETSEPCNHFPFLSPPCKKNQTVEAEHQAWMRAHVKHCQDENRGIQLLRSTS